MSTTERWLLGYGSWCPQLPPRADELNKKKLYINNIKNMFIRSGHIGAKTNNSCVY